MSDLSPGSDAWNRIVTASKVAAILGLSPWESPRSMWHRMRGELPREPQSAAMTRGHLLEPAILEWWRQQHAEEMSDHEIEQPSYALDDWAAATPDMLATTPDGVPVLVEAKSTSRLDGWGEPGTDQIPLYYLTQVIWQMHVSGVHRCYVPILGPRLEFAEYAVDYAPYAEDAALIEQKARAFWESLAGDEPPELDGSVATYDAARKIHPDIDRGTEVEVTRAQAVELAQAIADEKDAAARARLAKSTVLDLMGRAQWAKHNGATVARRQSRGEAVTFVAVAKPEQFTGDAA